MSPEPIQSDVITEAQALVVAFESHLWLRKRVDVTWTEEQFLVSVVTALTLRSASDILIEPKPKLTP